MKQQHRSKKRYYRKKEIKTALLFLFPSLIGISIFVLVPFLDVIKRSFCQGMSKKFVGLENYKTVFESKAFHQAVGNTGRFLIWCIPILLLLSFALSFLLHTRKGRSEFFKTSFLVPMAVPVASVVLLWKLFFHVSGLINTGLQSIGKTQIDFINTDMSFWVLIFSYLWKNTGYDMILWLSGLDGISKSLYEAASVDGAGTITKLRYITLPELKPTFFTISILSFINSFKVFREVYLIAGEYPHKKIYMLQHLFNNWFLKLDIQKMTSGAVILVGAILILVIVFWHFVGKETMK